jgi:hypothetical protein
MTESENTLAGFKRVDGCTQTHYACPCLTALKAERDEAHLLLAKVTAKLNEMIGKAESLRCRLDSAVRDLEHSLVVEARLMAKIEKLRSLLKLAGEVLDDGLENRPSRHSIGPLHAQIRAALGEEEKL